jgi:hypothetical protein
MAKKYKISGKRSGPPPLRGPNPNVPPIKMKYGGGADMGDPGRAQERADRGYGNVGPAQDKGSPEQNINQRNVVREGRARQFESKIDRPSPLDTAFKGAKLLGNIATFGVSKALDIPLGAMRVAKNIIDPIAGTVSNKLNTLGINNRKNLNDYDPMFHTARYNPPPAPISGEGGESGKGLCPDGTMPPCQVVQASDGKSIRVRGTKAAIRGTGFKGVF